MGVSMVSQIIYCVEKFGDAYKRYMQSVPAAHLFTGVIRLLRRRAQG